MRKLLLLATFGIFTMQSCMDRETSAEALPSPSSKSEEQHIEENQVPPPLPLDSNLTSSQELKYIFETDQSDRINGIFLQDISRDSLRLARVEQLYLDKKIITTEDKYHAAFIFIHAGGPLTESNPQHYYIAFSLFKEVSETATDPDIAREAVIYSQNAITRYFYAVKTNKERSEVSDVHADFRRELSVF